MMGKTGCFGSPSSYVLRFHNSFLYISIFTDIFIVVQKIISWKAELICLCGSLRLCCLAGHPISDERRKALDLFLDFYRKEKDFVPFQIGFRSLASDCVKILPI